MGHICNKTFSYGLFSYIIISNKFNNKCNKFRATVNAPSAKRLLEAQKFIFENCSKECLFVKETHPFSAVS